MSTVKPDVNKFTRAKVTVTIALKASIKAALVLKTVRNVQQALTPIQRPMWLARLVSQARIKTKSDRVSVFIVTQAANSLHLANPPVRTVLLDSRRVLAKLCVKNANHQSTFSRMKARKHVKPVLSIALPPRITLRVFVIKVIMVFLLEITSRSRTWISLNIIATWKHL